MCQIGTSIYDKLLMKTISMLHNGAQWLKGLRILVVTATTAILVAACGTGSSEPMKYGGLSMGLPVPQFVDSLLAQGFSIDSAASDSGQTVVLMHPQKNYRLLLGFQGDDLLVVQENYQLSTNDSTRNLWQEKRDALEKELGAWPDCPKLGDDHKIANFETEDGFISVVLENTYTPTLQVSYKKKTAKK